MHYDSTCSVCDNECHISVKRNLRTRRGHRANREGGGVRGGKTDRRTDGQTDREKFTTTNRC